MTNLDFPEALCIFIEDSVPTLEAAEVLITLSRNPARQWKPEDIMYQLQPTIIAESEIRKCLSLFRARGLVIENQDACFQYQPASEALDSTVSALAKAYNERPVTLIRLICSRKI